MSKTYLEYRRGESDRYADRQREESVREALDDGAAALSGFDQDFEALADVVVNDLIPDLIGRDGRMVRQYDRQIDSEDWHPNALGWLVDELEAYGPDLVCRRFSEDPAAVQTDRLVRAYQSCGAIAAHEEIVSDDLQSRVDAVGITSKVGEHLQEYQMDIGDPVQIISERSGAVKTLFTGGTGQGKSTGAEAEAEDYYRQTFRDGRDYKIIDLLDMRDGETWFYDVPQADESLRRIREEMGLPVDFTEENRPAPEVEILVPLTPGLSTQQLPYDLENGQFRIRPFTVPAAEIRKPLLISMVSAKLSDQQESVVRAAYDDLDRRRRDWTLSELADEIRNRDELKPGDKRPVVRTLDHLQQQGFVRDSTSDYTIDWREIFTSPERITVFSQAFIDSEIAQLLCVGYLVDALVKEREDMYGVPEAVVLIRELWKIAPHRQRRSFDSRAAGLQQSIGTMLVSLFRENRHSGVHLAADTQKVSDLLKSVREMFNRYVVFDAAKDTVKDICDWTANDKWRSFYNTLTPEPGTASVIGMVEPAMREREIEFVGPVQYAAPAHHHRRAKADDNGWRARAKLLEEEDLRDPSEMGMAWPDRLPDRFRIDGVVTQSEQDIHEAPVASFASDCLVQDTGGEPKVRVYRAFNAYMTDHGRPEWDFDGKGVRQRFGSRLNDALEPTPVNTKRDGSPAYQNYRLSDHGEQYLAAAEDEQA
jgi:hypothetical protein